MGAPCLEKPNDKKILIEEYIAKTQSRENNYEQHLLAGATATSQACTRRGWARVRFATFFFKSCQQINHYHDRAKSMFIGMSKNISAKVLRVILLPSGVPFLVQIPTPSRVPSWVRT